MNNVHLIRGTDGLYRDVSNTCWYCGVELISIEKDKDGIPTTRPNLRTDEHLICTPKGRRNKYKSRRNDKGKVSNNGVRVSTRYLTHHPHNIRRSCHRCNSYVGDWHIERKIKFAVWIREVGWDKVNEQYPPGRGRKKAIEQMLDNSSLTIKDNNGD